MAKAAPLSPAERIAEIQAADAAARLERADLDKLTLTDLVAAATEAEAAVKRVEAACSQLVSDITTGALKAQGKTMSVRLRNIITVAESDLAKVVAVLTPQEA